MNKDILDGPGAFEEFSEDIKEVINTVVDLGTKAGFDPSQTRDSSGKWSDRDGELTDNEIASINHYTDDGFQEINTKLLTGSSGRDSVAYNKIVDNQITEINQGLSKLPPHIGVVFRGDHIIRSDEWDSLISNLKIGNEWGYKGFLSTSTKEHIASDFIYDIPSTIGRVMYEITSKNGKNISEYSQMKWEDEVLFTPKTRFRIDYFKDESLHGERPFYKIKLTEI